MAERLRLDPRPRRQDLTSRECCSILGGFIAGAIQCWGAPLVRDFLRAYVKLEATQGKEGTAEMEVLSSKPGANELASMLGSLLGALDDNCAHGAALDGCIWWAERTDEDWSQIFPVIASGRVYSMQWRPGATS